MDQTFETSLPNLLPRGTQPPMDQEINPMVYIYIIPVYHWVIYFQCTNGIFHMDHIYIYVLITLVWYMYQLHICIYYTYTYMYYNKPPYPWLCPSVCHYTGKKSTIMIIHWYIATMAIDRLIINHRYNKPLWSLSRQLWPMIDNCPYLLSCYIYIYLHIYNII